MSKTEYPNSNKNETQAPDNKAACNSQDKTKETLNSSSMIKFNAPKNQSSIIKVIGVGGGGSNAVNHMCKLGIKDVDFVVCNTDAQALSKSEVPVKIQLGAGLTEGRGAGSLPEVGKESAIENIEEIQAVLENNTKMLFITAGMGGGTGTGAAPIIAAKAKEQGILTVGIVTVPFAFEGRKRALQAKEGIKELRKHVDSLLIINNDKLRELYGNLELSKAFGEADGILTTAAKGIAEIITMTGYVNVDFEDVRTVMKESGVAIMGAASAEGEDRAINAVAQALESPLLNDNNIKGASDMLLYITSGDKEVLMDEITQITEYIQKEAGDTVEVIWGNGYDSELGNKINITLIATGFDTDNGTDYYSTKEKRSLQSSSDKIKKPTRYQLDDDVDKTKMPKDQNTEKESEALQFKLKTQTEEPKRQEDKNIDKEVSVQSSVNSSNQDDNKKIIEKTQDGMVFFIRKEEAKEEANKNVSTQQEKEKEVVEPQMDFSAQAAPDKNDNPVSKTETKENPSEKQHVETLGTSRQNYLKELSITLKDPSAINKMEAEPAYKRSECKISEVPHSSESQISRYTLSTGSTDDDKPKLKENNSYLHEKPD